LDSESYFFRPVCPERRWHPAVDALVIICIDYVHEIKAFGVLIFLRAFQSITSIRRGLRRCQGMMMIIISKNTSVLFSKHLPAR
jgi:hypothetical protein